MGSVKTGSQLWANMLPCSNIAASIHAPLNSIPNVRQPQLVSQIGVTTRLHRQREWGPHTLSRGPRPNDINLIGIFGRSPRGEIQHMFQATRIYLPANIASTSASLKPIKSSSLLFSSSASVMARP